MVTWDNYEEYMVMHADGELNASEEQALQAFISGHKELQSEMALYEQIRLSPDTTEVFVNKGQLLKQEPAGRVISLKQWRSYGIAAGLAALLCLGIMKWLQPVNRPAIITDAQPLHHKTTSPAVIRPTATVTTMTTVNNIPKQARNTNKTPQKTNNTIAIVEQARLPIKDETMSITKMDIIAPKIAANAAPATVAMETIPVNNTAITAIEADENLPKVRKDLLDILTATDGDRPGMEAIKSVVASSIQQVQQIKKNIKQTDISFKIGGREIAVINF
jgi:hypothetical protein